MKDDDHKYVLSKVELLWQNNEKKWLAVNLGKFIYLQVTKEYEGFFEFW